MAGVDDSVVMIGEWGPPTPSPRAFFSTILGEEMMSSRATPGETSRMDDGLFLGTRGQMTAAAAAANGGGGGGGGGKGEANNVSQGNNFMSSPFAEEEKSSSRGLVERIAARAGFNAPKLNTDYMRSTDLSLNPDKTRSPYLTIPPGLSPTTLLDSPVFLNSLAQPSPTTGQISLYPNGNSKSSAAMMSESAYRRSKDHFFEDINSTSFAFKTFPESSSSFFTVPTTKVSPLAHPQQPFPSNEVPLQSENSLHSHTQHTKLLPQSFHFTPDFSKPAAEEIYGKAIATNTTGGGGAARSPPLNDDQDEEGDQRDSSVAEAPADDGYNWRKYGQKQVKGSEYPRSYYKCTHQTCPVKKKVERSHEGHITEIIYKGAHNHPKPSPNRRANTDTNGDLTGQQSAPENDPALATLPHKGAMDSFEVTSSASPEFGNPSSSLHTQNRTHFESSEAVDASSTFSNDEEDDDRATHNSVGYDGEGDESESKRRKIEAYTADMSGASRAIREPRVVVQTTSEVDILDDGYRWRKYGQKVVKGNPNPRSYYKCTNAGCTVRKHVERASHDLKSVITTYEGKHNHDVPAARNSSHVGSGTSTVSQAPRPDPLQLHNNNIMSRGFDRSAAFGSFRLQQQQQQQMGVLPSHHNFSFGMNQPGLANMAMAGFSAGGGQPKMPSSSSSSSSMHPYLAAQQRPFSEMGFMLPKGEPKMEPISEPNLNLSNNAALYQQIMSRLPLGPQM